LDASVLSFWVAQDDVDMDAPTAAQGVAKQAQHLGMNSKKKKASTAAQKAAPINVRMQALLSHWTRRQEKSMSGMNSMDCSARVAQAVKESEPAIDVEEAGGACFNLSAHCASLCQKCRLAMLPA